MKKLIAVALLSTTAVSFAAERNIYDLMYLPRQGTFFGFTTASYEAANLYESSAKADVDGYKFEQTVGYSFMDNFSLNLAMNYQNYRTESDIAGVNDFTKRGLSDLDVNAKFRVMEGDMDLDILAYAQIGIDDQKINSNGDINNYNGGNTLGLGAQLGQRQGTFQWSVLGRVDRIFEANIENNTAGGGNQNADAHNRYIIQGDILGKMTEQVFFRAALSATVVDSYDVENSSFSNRNDYKISGEFQHLTSQNLLFRAGIANSNVEYAGIDQYTVWNFFAGANYQF